MTQTIFTNLFNAIKEEKANELTRFTNELNEMTTKESILGAWHLRNLFSKSKEVLARNVWTLEELKNYLIARQTKKTEKQIVEKLTHLQTVEKASDLLEITFNVEWKKSKMWGSNPSCEAKEHTAGEYSYYHYYNSGSISGCGYDKESTAIANAANQSNSLLKALYLFKEQNPSVKNHELFGYGSGYGILPRLEGGVGVSCYPKIFEKIGFTWRNVGSGRSFDVYVAAKS